eukprot:2907247-Rhodomonas_salina.3
MRQERGFWHLASACDCSGTVPVLFRWIAGRRRSRGNRSGTRCTSLSTKHPPHPSPSASDLASRAHPRRMDHTAVFKHPRSDFLSLMAARVSLSSAERRVLCAEFFLTSTGTAQLLKTSCLFRFTSPHVQTCPSTSDPASSPLMHHMTNQNRASHTKDRGK